MFRKLFYRCLLLLISFQNILCVVVRENITFESSPSHLRIPNGLHAHFSTVHNNSEVHLFGGSTNSDLTSSYSLYTIKSDNAEILNGTITTDTFTDLPEWIGADFFPLLDWFYTPPQSISCASTTRCYTTINDTFYAFIPSGDLDEIPPYYDEKKSDYQNLFVHKYSKSTKTFANLLNSWDTANFVHSIAAFVPAIPPYDYLIRFEHIMYYMNGCIVSDGVRYIYSFGTTASMGSKYHGFQYDALLDVFTLKEFNLLNTAHDVGCDIDAEKENVYIFGGLSNDMLYINGGLSNDTAEQNDGFLYTNMTSHIQKQFSPNHTENLAEENATNISEDTALGWKTLDIYLPQALTSNNNFNPNITLKIDDEGPICCRASSSCYESGAITRIEYETQKKTDLVCSGRRACYKSHISNVNDTLFCEGRDSCKYSIINSIDRVYCSGDDACVSSNIFSAKYIKCDGWFSCMRANITSGGVNLFVYFNADASGMAAIIYCDKTDVCTVNCMGLNSCSNTQIVCDTAANCIINCDANIVNKCPVVSTYSTSQAPSSYTSIPSFFPSFNPSLSPSQAPSSKPRSTSSTVITTVVICSSFVIIAVIVMILRRTDWIKTFLNKYMNRDARVMNTIHASNANDDGQNSCKESTDDNETSQKSVNNTDDAKEADEITVNKLNIEKDENIIEGLPEPLIVSVHDANEPGAQANEEKKGNDDDSDSDNIYSDYKPPSEKIAAAVELQPATKNYYDDYHAKLWNKTDLNQWDTNSIGTEGQTDAEYKWIKATLERCDAEEWIKYFEHFKREKMNDLRLNLIEDKDDKTWEILLPALGVRMQFKHLWKQKYHK